MTTRVLHFVPWVTGGGVEVALRDLVLHLQPPEWEHVVACFIASGPRRDELRSAGCRIVELGGPESIRNVRGLLALTRLAREIRPHVIHGGVFEGQVFATVAGLLARVPVIVTDENNCPAPPAARSTVTERVLRVLLNQNSAVVAVSPTVQRYLLEQTGVRSDRVVMIAHGVPGVEVAPGDEVRAERARIGIPSGALVVGTVCRLFDGHKRVSDLIAAVAQVRGRGADVHLVVVGDGPDRQALEEMSVALGIADRVHFLGYRNDHGLLYGLMDVFALVSAFEAFGLVFAEAMSAGIPCIGSNVGGIPDVVAHGQSGLIVEKGDVGAIASAIERLANEPQLRRQMGDAARKRARDRFDVRRYAAEVAALYRKELEAARARGRY